ncbi:apolipoprotein D-like [Lycorma delicatula]|uniref:apolipoprotein D-like n=1 Tax=Lycorma delicatula TaxID=130591 RepID=UPI003F50F18D
MMGYTTRLLFLVTLSFILIIKNVSSHSYHLGSCPVVTPMANFNMEGILGKWYAIQKTSTSSRCLTYNFTKTNEPFRYKVEQVSEHPILGFVNIDNKYHYTGELSVIHQDIPSKMLVKFPLNVAGSASYTVFATDYRNYAAIFTCQKLPFSHRQSISLLSRHKSLPQSTLEELRAKIGSFGINPFDLSIIDQSGCKDEGYEINIDDETFSSHNIGNAVKKVGEKVGDGVEAVLEGSKKIINSVGNKNNDDRREEIIEHPESNEVEWLP